MINEKEREFLRLDKFLKVSRIIKRRSVAKEVADKGRISINGRPAKSGTDVKIGDELLIAFGSKDMTIRVDDIKETTRKDEADNMFTVISEKYREDKEKDNL
jgi:ribosomal 50S subunit-recycling heat shock protein